MKDLDIEKTRHSIVGFDKNKLKGTQTVEKNVLPDLASIFISKDFLFFS
jgi:hypothetical protein